jgi:hypothetical protein
MLGTVVASTALLLPHVAQTRYTTAARHACAPICGEADDVGGAIGATFGERHTH